MATFVLPLPGGEAQPTERSYSLENQDDLINHIDNSVQVQQMLEIDRPIGNGVWLTKFGNYVVVAEIKVSIGEALDKPWIDAAMRLDWGRYKPTEEEWTEYRSYIKRQLSMIIKSASGHNVDPNTMSFTVRRKMSKGAKVFMIVTS